MSSTRSVRCPVPSCGAVFEVAAERLGRNVRCPACSSRMTARPIGVLASLAAQELRLAGGTGAPDMVRLPLAALADNVRSLWNVGAMVRTADACGVELLALAGITGCPPRAEITKTALGAERAVAWRYHADPMSALGWLVARGWAPVALELAPGSVPVDELDWPDRPCLVVGNEVAGISPAVLDACPRRAHVPMRGVKSSLNVAVAFGIALHHAARAVERSVRRTARSVSG
jgi:tRNA G18 (ribose-2'-O)-methylase SpoU